MTHSEETVNLLFTLLYIFFSLCLIAPPTEFVSAGITIQNVLSNFLGSEDMNFIYYHIKRTSATVFVHSLFPLGYYVCLGLFSPQLNLFYPWALNAKWKLFLAISLILPVVAASVVYYWSRRKWDNHPIARQLHYLGNGDSWRAVASSINIEFRRIDKFMSGVIGRQVVVTDSWVMKSSTYFVYVAHQNDIHLTLAATEEHSISYESMTSVQYLNMDVQSINKNVKPFNIRLNSLEYRDLKDKLSSPIVNARNIVIKQSLSDQFLEAFREHVNSNHPFRLPVNMEADTCIGCMQKTADIKLVKLCDNMEEGDCSQCYCRPMWCLECIGKWFASRQEQSQPETWLGGKSPCPTCRAKFCVLDVCKIADS